MSENAQVSAPFSERVVTDYSKLTPEYLEHLQQKAEEARERQLAREATESQRAS